LSKAYAIERFRALFPNATQSQTPESTSGNRNPNGGDTVFLCAVDKDGNAVVMIQSLFQFLGSGRVVPGTGILLHDRGSSFSLDPKHANVIAPGKRPYHTLSPHMVLNPDGTPFVLMGTPGGDGQTQTLMQAFQNLTAFGMGPQAAVEAPRFRSHEDLRLAVEPGISEAVRAELQRLGHNVVVRPPSEEFGGAQMIVIHPVSKARLTGADMRREATSMAW
jgi:gamma-glutamyltranspeptidase/glutathione hydrolase